MGGLLGRRHREKRKPWFPKHPTSGCAAADGLKPPSSVQGFSVTLLHQTEEKQMFVCATDADQTACCVMGPAEVE